jgi:hypothetical protein
MRFLDKRRDVHHGWGITTALYSLILHMDMKNLDVLTKDDLWDMARLYAVEDDLKARTDARRKILEDMENRRG